MTYRNRALLDLCHEAPCFLLLGAPGCGTNPSVPVHSDMIRHGRGVGHKSHDCFAPPGCPACHERFKRSILGHAGYLEAWTAAMERYILWLWVSERIKVATRRAPERETSMEPPKCRLCEKNHWPRAGCDFGPTKNTKERKPETPGAGASKPVLDTSREGRDVLKAQATSTERDHRNAQPATATPGKKAGRQGTAAKPAPGKRKTATKIIATYTPPKAKRKWVKKP